jgi:O-acetyl-ADP-ribose deacetylase (regulator of RNase III)
MEIEFPNGKNLRLLIGDITKIRVDAMVNAANSALAGGGGVDGAIHRAGGSAIMRDLDVIRQQQGGCPTGSAVATTAGSLPAQYVFHAVGPIYRDGRQGEAENLASCYSTCLKLAEERGARSVSFPSISTGAYGYPMEEAARIALRTIGEQLREQDAGVREVLLVLYDQGSYDVHSRAAQALFADRIK